MKKISDKAYSKLEERIKKLKYISNIYRDRRKEIYNLYDKIDTLKNHVIMMDQFEQEVLIFTLSVECIKLFDKYFPNYI